MTTLLHRTADGTTELANGTTFKVPKNRSALSMFGTNRISHGDVFAEDGWVYQEGKKVRKWFTRFLPHGDETIWEPKLKDVVTLEAKRWKYLNRPTRDKLNRQWKENYDKVMAAAPFLAKMPRTGKRSEGKIFFEIHDRDERQYVSWNWVSIMESGNRKVPKGTPTHQKLADEFFYIEDRLMECSTRRSLFFHAFLSAINKKYVDAMFPRKRSSGDPTTLHLIINGRDYWFRPSPSPRLDYMIEPIALPEDTQIITETVNGPDNPSA